MKKTITIFGILILTTILVTGCGSGNDTAPIPVDTSAPPVEESSVEAQTEEPEEAAIEPEIETEAEESVLEPVYDLGDEVVINLDFSFIDGWNPQEVIDDAEADGILVIPREDGSFDFVFERGAHERYMREYADSISEDIADMIAEGTFASIQEVIHNNTLTEFDVLVDGPAFENSFDGFITLYLSIHGLLYQQLNGTPDNTVTVSIIDIESGEIISSSVFPEAFEGLVVN